MTSIKDVNQPIQVYVRVRPLNEKEVKGNSSSCIKVLNDKEICVLQQHEKKYLLDGIFSQHTTQLEVYEKIGKPLVKEVLTGYSCTVFAYGQTGTGKTYTIAGLDDNNLHNNPVSSGYVYGCDSDAGIILRFFHDLFEDLHLQKLEFTIRISFIELYNEEIFDLLTPLEDTYRLRIYEDQKQKGSVILHGCQEVIVRSKEDVFNLLKTGFIKKRTAPTLMNAHSSRSHTVFTATVHIREKKDDEDVMRIGKINFVDLAGSENISKSGASNIRAREAGSINTSLLTLARVNQALIEKSSHIPYRESKLTRILQDSLGGKTKTLIIVTISPLLNNKEETLSTLDYANRARNIHNRPEINKQLSKKAMLEQCSDEITRLQKELQAYYTGDGVYMVPETFEKLKEELQLHKTAVSEKIMHCRDLTERVSEMERREQMILKNFEECKSSLEKVNKEATEVKGNLTKNITTVAKQEEEINYLLDKHECLLEDSKKLLSVAKTSSIHEDIFQNKLKHLMDVIKKNRSTARSIMLKIINNYENHKKKIQDVIEKSKEIQKLEKNEFKSLYLKNYKVNQTYSEYSVKLNKLEKRFNEQILKIAEHDKEIERERLDVGNYISESVEDCIKRNNNVISEFQTGQLNNFNMKQEKLQSFKTQKINGLKERLRTFTSDLNDTQELLSDSEKLKEKNLEHLKEVDKFSDLVKKKFVNIQSLNQEMHRNVTYKIKLILKEMDEVQKLNENYTSNIEQNVSDLNKLLLEEKSRSAEIFFKKKEENKDIIMKHLDILDNHSNIITNNFVEEIKKECAEQQDKSEMCKKEISSLNKEVDKIVDTWNYNFQKMKEKQMNSCQDFMQKSSQIRKTDVQQTLQILEETENAYNTFEDVGINITNDYRKFTKEISEKIKQKKDLNASLFKESMTTFENIHNDVELWDHNLLVRTFHKGDTPCKMNYSIPKVVLTPGLDCKKNLIDMIKESEDED